MRSRGRALGSLVVVKARAWAAAKAMPARSRRFGAGPRSVHARSGCGHGWSSAQKMPYDRVTDPNNTASAGPRRETRLQSCAFGRVLRREFISRRAESLRAKDFDPDLLSIRGAEASWTHRSRRPLALRHRWSAVCMVSFMPSSRGTGACSGLVCRAKSSAMSDGGGPSTDPAPLAARLRGGDRAEHCARSILRARAVGRISREGRGDTLQKPKVSRPVVPVGCPVAPAERPAKRRSAKAFVWIVKSFEMCALWLWQPMGQAGVRQTADGWGFFG